MRNRLRIAFTVGEGGGGKRKDMHVRYTLLTPLEAPMIYFLLLQSFFFFFFGN